MTESQKEVHTSVRAAYEPSDRAREVQWMCFVVISLFALIALAELKKADAPGAPAWTVYAMIGVSVAVAVLHIPPLFWRLPEGVRTAIWLSLLMPFVAYDWETRQMEASWVKTPEGARELSEQREADRRLDEQIRQERVEAAGRAETEEKIAQAAASLKKLQELTNKLEGCFTNFGHRLRGLEQPVKDALHNPRSFEHVETSLIVPDEDSNNVQLTFREENEFGAIRTRTIRAQLNADDCTVHNIGNLEPRSN